MSYEPISLAELNARAALLTRVDRKYILDAPTFARLEERLAGGFLVLEIDGLRRFTYDTVYFDSAALDAYHAHLQGRRRRYKCRSRRYVESGRQVFEVKLKGLRGATVKHQLEVADHGVMTDAARAFAEEVLRDAYGHDLAPQAPVLAMTYRRMTLAARDGVERLTCDFDLSFPGGALAPGHVIVESKSERGRGPADRALRALGAHPVSCSKYCAGIGLTRDVRANPFARLLRRYYVAATTGTGGSLPASGTTRIAPSPVA
jgi:hypothetical protein